TEASRWQCSSILGSDRTSIARLDDDCGSVGEHLGDAVHDFGCVVTHTEDRVCAQLARMLEHQLERLKPGLFAQLGEKADVAAHDSLQRSAERSEDRPRADRDASHYTDGPNYAETWEFERGGDHRIRNN